MLGLSQKLSRSLAALFSLALALPGVARAQTAPVIGDHYAARASDTGFAGVGSNGDYGASVPLALPGAKGGLPVPVQVVHGGRFGAAGLGWDVPLSFIRHHVTAAYRRPVSAGDASPQARDQYALSLNGDPVTLVPIGQNKYHALRGTDQLEVADLGGGVFEMYDGNGLRYSFSSTPNGSSPLDNGNLYLLTDIFGPGGAKVHLDYTIGTPSLGSGSTGLAIDLASVSYNFNGTGSDACEKHKIKLNYGADASSPLSISMLSSTALVRFHKLREDFEERSDGKAIEVMAREVAADQPVDCASAMKSLRAYRFEYENDADTGQRQLQQVTMFGQEGTTERGVRLPVAGYTYGKVTGSDGKLSYSARENLLLPSDVNISADGIFGLGATQTLPNVGSNPTTFTLKGLIDVNGDGRPDLIYSHGASFTGPGARLWLNRPDTGFTDAGYLNPSANPNATPPLPAMPFLKGIQVSQSIKVPVQVGGNPNSISGVSSVLNMVSTQLIDMNGDGRLDIVTNEPSAPGDDPTDVWTVWLNTPDTANSNAIVWQKRTISTVKIAQHLVEASLLDQNDPSIHHLPLSRSITAKTILLRNCWIRSSGWTESNGVQGWSSDGSTPCQFPQGDDAAKSNYDTDEKEGETTIVQWRLQDINGDGYPDFVYGSPVTAQIQKVQPSVQELGNIAFTNSIFSLQQFTSAPIVKALINVAGVHLDTATNAFSAPAILEANNEGGDVCGGVIEKWAPGSPTHTDRSFPIGTPGRSNQVCGLEDVNGDGVADRVTATVSFPTPGLPDQVLFTLTAKLGTGNLNAPFASVTMPLPGPLTIEQREIVDLTPLGRTHHYATPPALCPTLVYYPQQRTAGLRDLNGDGIPDYIQNANSDGVPNSSTDWTVRFGTGAGFSNPVPITGAFELSRQRVDCKGIARDDGSQFVTGVVTGGLYDMNGDGVPDIVLLDESNGHLGTITKLPTPGISGKITTIEHGYGAATNITYRSAKEDGSTNHLVPFPEVVVASVTTADADSNNPIIAPVLYAYGGASQYFDAAADRWVFPGYQRKVSAQNTTGGVPEFPEGSTAIITDSYPLAPFDPAMDATTRLLRYLKAGRTRDITTISNAIPRGDPWGLLNVDVASQALRIAASHMDYSARLLADGSNATQPNNPQYCLDMVDPYNYGFSLNYANTTADTHDQCAERGFALETSVTSYRGRPITAENTVVVGTADVIVTPNIVKTGSVITVFDNFGRVTDSINKGDLADTNDDLCVHVDYASPVTDRPTHVLNAVFQQIVKAQTAGQDCGGATLAKKSFQYFKLSANTVDPVGQVSDGFVASSTVTRYDMDSHNSLGDIKLFDATYNANGTLKSITKTRDDGATTTSTVQYDPFGLIATSATSSATNADGTPLPPISTAMSSDALTLAITSTTDANGTVSGATYDGFGRLTTSTITKPDGTGGILSSTTYAGFEFFGNGNQSRSITQKVFTDAVSDKSAPGRTSTTSLDSLGRTLKTEVQLGADYQNETLVVGSRIYDDLGRVSFVADPFPSTGAFSYGTSYNYNIDGTPFCFVRAPFALSPRDFVPKTVDEANSYYPTCFNRSFANNQEIWTRSNPDALLSGSPQDSVTSQTIRTAMGRALESRTLASDGSALKDAIFGYDTLGHLTSMTRYQKPANQTSPVHTFWHYDSLGQVTKLVEDGVAPRSRTYDSWGELTQEQWCNDLTDGNCPSVDRRTITRYDARGRVTHTEDQSNNSGQPVTGTARDFTYDTGVNNVTPPVTATNMKGRLAKASWPTGTASFSYDGLGRMNTKVFTDTTVTPNNDNVCPNNVYVEKHDVHGDGSEHSLSLLLPDTCFKEETVTYNYDTAGRINSALYSDGATPPTTQSLFAANGTNAIYDELGRITNALYGSANFSATFEATGRRLLQDVLVTSGTHSREIKFPVNFNGLVTAYDPLGRERQRREFVDGTPGVVQMRAYDVLGQLNTTQSLQVTTNTITTNRSFAYDPLGNINSQNDTQNGHPGSVGLSYGPTDLERLCGVAYTTTTPPQCSSNVTYDGAGNVLSMPTRAGGTRALSYFPGGAVSGIIDGASNATFNYDAFGALQQLTVNTTSADMRADSYFGAFLKQRKEGANSVLTRQIPAPGVAATKHGASGGWTFAFGESRGTRFVTDQSGAFVQDTTYAPFGAATSTGPAATPGTTNYTSEQWNGGDLLQTFGLVNLGARLYDPLIGRFLARDPLIGRNAYAFADNDPINKSDPTGLEPKENPGGPGNNPGNGPTIVGCDSCGFGFTELAGIQGGPTTNGGPATVTSQFQQFASSGAAARADDPRRYQDWSYPASIKAAPDRPDLDAWRQKWLGPSLTDVYSGRVPTSFAEYLNDVGTITAYSDSGDFGELATSVIMHTAYTLVSNALGNDTNYSANGFSSWGGKFMYAVNGLPVARFEDRALVGIPSKADLFMQMMPSMIELPDISAYEIQFVGHGWYSPKSGEFFGSAEVPDHVITDTANSLIRSFQAKGVMIDCVSLAICGGSVRLARNVASGTGLPTRAAPGGTEIDHVIDRIGTRLHLPILRIRRGR